MGVPTVFQIFIITITSVHSTIKDSSSKLTSAWSLMCIFYRICVCDSVPIGSSDNTWWHTFGMIAVKQGNKTWIASTVAIVTPQPLTLQRQPVPGRWGRVYFFIVAQRVSHTKHEACVSQTCNLWCIPVFILTYRDRCSHARARLDSVSVRVHVSSKDRSAVFCYIILH